MENLSDNRELQREIFEKLKQGVINIDDLDVNSHQHILALIQYFKERPSKMASLSTAKEIELLKKVLYDDNGYELFVSMPKECHNIEFINIYLYKRLTNEIKQQYIKINNLESDSNNSNITVDINKIKIRKSYDGNLVFFINYQSMNGQEVTYFDKKLQVPISLLSVFQIDLKLIDSLKFIRKIDVEVSILGYYTINDLIISLVSKVYRKVLYELTSKEEISYYELVNNYFYIEKALALELDKILIDYGICVSSISVSDISIQNNIKEILDKDYFKIRREKLENESRLDFEQKSLKLYAEKIEIQSKFPGFAETLTEAEKDNAFRRYALKNKPNKNSVEILEKTPIKINKRTEDIRIEEKLDKPLELNYKSSNIYTIVSIISFLVGLVLFILGLNKIIDLGLSLILCGLCVAICSASYIFNAVNEKNKKTLIGGKTNDPKI